ncbi:hypothetical protein KGD83_09320 [Nocardiopsis akebiae]|uniref:Uncharacterized protein n=1 Tax=Nocardiopsis akebiae TaxID=2831968 RepID=A0ABX8CDN4_9ACTN|nr:hypothetical protein [Nocardiopsis akebiae]QUX30668.1 hypothetical protein KGD83_09320 [Nocardiopsis akebiae]
MRTFTRITAAAVLAAGLTAAGTGAAAAAAADQDDSRPGGVLGFLFDGVFGENADPPVVGEDDGPPEVSGAPGTTAEEAPVQEAPAEGAPAAPAEQGTDTGGATGGM